MLTWLVDNRGEVFLLLGVAALTLAVAWWKLRQRKYLVSLAVVGVLGVILALLGLFIVTDSEQIVRRVRDMAGAVADKKPERIFAHVSDRFRYQTLGKAEFRGIVGHYIQSGEVQELRVWNFETRDVSRKDRTATVIFMVRARGSRIMNDVGYWCAAKFVLDPDQEWRLQTFRVTLPTQDPTTGDAIDVPLGR